jgi:molybdopterin-guanine dinucleotide biosynthesis protein A
MTIPAAILAGGAARRMGGVDKAAIVVGGKSILERTLSVLHSHCDPIALIGRPSAPAPLIARPDPVAGREGPLSGILAALDWAPHPWIMIVPCDTPFLPADLVPRLWAERAGVDLVRTESLGCDHPTVALWRRDLRVPLAEAFSGGTRAIRDFTRTVKSTLVSFDADRYDPFMNLNSPADVEAAAAIGAQA